MTKFEERAVRYITDLIRDFQLEDYQAAGFPGNFGEETGGFEHVQEIAPIGGGAGGLGDNQATGPRRRRFEAWLAKNQNKGWNANTYEANYSFIWRELTGQPGESNESATIPAVRRATNVDEAAEIVMNKYERPNPNYAHLDVRKSYAHKALNAFRASGIDVAALKAMGRATDQPKGEVVVMNTEKKAEKPHLDIEQILSLLTTVLPFIQNFMAAKQSGKPMDFSTIFSPPPAAPTEPVKTETAASPMTRPSVQLSTIMAIAGTALQAFGVVGPPAGTGSTVAGTLTTLIPLASAALGATGVWGKVAGVGLNLIGNLVANSKPKS